MADKSYNSRALGGDTEYDDVQFQTDMKKRGIHVPDDMLFKPEMNKFVLGEVRNQTVAALQAQADPNTGMNYTKAAAEMKAQESYDAQMGKFSNLCGHDLTKLK